MEKLHSFTVTKPRQLFLYFCGFVLTSDPPRSGQVSAAHCSLHALWLSRLYVSFKLHRRMSSSNLICRITRRLTLQSQHVFPVGTVAQPEGSLEWDYMKHYVLLHQHSNEQPSHLVHAQGRGSHSSAMWQDCCSCHPIYCRSQEGNSCMPGSAIFIIFATLQKCVT